MLTLNLWKPTMDDDLVCNFKKCRKRITNVAWVTSCSHIFCEEDGSREFSRQQVCPACDSVLSGQLDFIQVDIHPSEQYKSMVLAGQRPEIIMEICSRAMSFWTYQAHQERAYQEYVATKALEKSQKQEGYYEQLLTVNQTELTSAKVQANTLKKDLEAVKTKYNEVSEKMMEKTRQYQKLQGMYETLRRRNINPSSLDGEVDRGSPRSHRHSLKPHPFESTADRNASLPHNLHKHQTAGLLLSSGHMPALSMSVDNFLGHTLHPTGGNHGMGHTLHPAGGNQGHNLHQAGGAVATMASAYQLDSALAAAVNTAAFQAHQAKPGEKFVIKMPKGGHGQQESK